MRQLTKKDGKRRSYGLSKLPMRQLTLVVPLKDGMQLSKLPMRQLTRGAVLVIGEMAF